MNKNPTLPQRREKIKALAIRFLILGTPLTKATSLPPIVMALEKYLVDQANRPGLKQSWNQIKLRPFHIHFHHHKVLLRRRVLQPLCKIKPVNLIHLTSIWQATPKPATPRCQGVAVASPNLFFLSFFFLIKNLIW
jgi:hypothetical protein